MRAGSLDKRIVVQRRSGDLDEFGTEDNNTWSTIHSPWSRIAMQGGKEFQRAQIIFADIEQLFITRYCSELAAVTEKDRIAYNGKYYDIRSVNNVGERNVELQFLCTLHR